MTRYAHLVVLLLTLGLLTACPTGRNGGGGDDDDDSGPADDDDGAEDDDDAVPENETDCQDGVDEDQDGVTDCEDDDCFDVAPCWWPEALDHVGDVQFDGWEIECDFMGVPVPYEVDDCATTYTSPLGMDLTVDPCASCDRTFEGPFTYSVDSCSDLLPDSPPPPASGAFGLVFTSETEWQVWSQNADGVWNEVGAATDDGSGTFVYTAESVITDDPPDCNNGDQDLGNLVVTLSFTETP